VNKKLFFSGLLMLLLSGVFISLHFFLKPPPSNLEMKIRSKPAIMPIAYKVYGNPDALDGRFWLVKLVLTNTGEGSVKNLKISYRIPDYIDWTTPSIYKEVIPGQTVIDRFYPKFPPKIINVMNPTPASVEIKISYNNGVETVEDIRKVSFQIRGRNEFIYTDLPPEEIADITDAYENIELLAAFVTPEDPIIKYFTQQLQQKVLKGTVAGVVNAPEEIQRFMNALYDFEVGIGMVYGGTLGLPEKVGNSYTIVQRIRLPREVLTGGAGLCVELSTLFCSVAISAGLNCGIFLTSKHAFPGIITQESVYPIEATAIGGQGIGKVHSFQEALQMGIRNFQAWAAGGNPDIGIQIGFVDVNRLQSEGIRPPELPDDVNLRKKIDELFAKFEKGGKAGTAVARERRNEEVAVGGGNTRAGGTGERRTRRESAPSNFVLYREPSGILEVAVPANWRMQEYPLPAYPYLVLGAESPDMKKTLEVYVYPGFMSVDEAFQDLVNGITASGLQISYRKSGSKVINGKNYIKYTGTTIGDFGKSVWEAYFTTTDVGVVGFSVGVINDSFSRNKRILNKIINSFRVLQ